MYVDVNRRSDLKNVFIRSVVSLLLMGYAASADTRVLIDLVRRMTMTAGQQPVRM